ncbi:MAG: DUF993 family protein [Hyphomicrobiales bacterium]|nr:DUF993 family protein [Hyphomicrobiales bacterium]MDE2113562.1 dihydrodipicolinate synthase family protein [Hyphomicrobiales bacterium]
MVQVQLPVSDGSLQSFRVHRASPYDLQAHGAFPRVVYAAAHVVANPLNPDPWGRPQVDWEATLAFRHHLWGLNFKIAEAMDTSQRGMGFDWANARELIQRVLADARTVKGADLASGAGTDQLDLHEVPSLDDVIRAYETQVEFIEGQGGRIIMMASRALAKAAGSADDYFKVYDRVLSGCRNKVILHWLGDMFDPALKGYWGSREVGPAMDCCLAIINAHASRIDGIKISLLDARYEIELRRRLPAGVRMYTGDDFNYAELIAGDEMGHSHGLLGIFDAIAPAAAAALIALGKGDLATYNAILAPTVPLSRKIFEAPTQYYKAGIVFLAWLNGFQSHFTMVGGMQSARSIVHYAEIFRLAHEAGLLRDPELAARRMTQLCAVSGAA